MRLLGEGKIKRRKLKHVFLPVTLRVRMPKTRFEGQTLDLEGSAKCPLCMHCGLPSQHGSLMVMTREPHENVLMGNRSNNNPVCFTLGRDFQGIKENFVY